MSRTHKDRPHKLKPEASWDHDMVRIEGSNRFSNCILQLPTTKTKKRKEVDSEFHWMTTPSWFIREFMNKPQRRQNKLWEAHFKNRHIKEWCNCMLDKPTMHWIENLDTPSVSRKPEVYYW